jgi:hypothetical protein
MTKMKKRKVDNWVAELVGVMKAIDGVEINVRKSINGVESALASRDVRGLSYVAFHGSNAYGFACEMVALACPAPGITAMTDSAMTDKDYGYRFEMKFNGGWGYCMLWSPASYRLVLKAAKQVSDRLRHGREREQVARSPGTT